MHQPAERGSDVKGASSLSQRRRICPAHQSRLPWEGCTGSACLTPSSVCMTHGHPRGHGQEPTEGLTTAACGAHEASSSGLPRPAETMGQGICTGGTWGPAQELCTGATWVSAASGPGPGKLRRWAGTSGAHHCKATARNHVHACVCLPTFSCAERRVATRSHTTTQAEDTEVLGTTVRWTLRPHMQTCTDSCLT